MIAKSVGISSDDDSPHFCYQHRRAARSNSLIHRIGCRIDFLPATSVCLSRKTCENDFSSHSGLNPSPNGSCQRPVLPSSWIATDPQRDHILFASFCSRRTASSAAAKEIVSSGLANDLSWTN